MVAWSTYVVTKGVYMGWRLYIYRWGVLGVAATSIYVDITGVGIRWRKGSYINITREDTEGRIVPHVDAIEVEMECRL